jgi:hypothetical protein
MLNYQIDTTYVVTARIFFHSVIPSYPITLEHWSWIFDSSASTSSSLEAVVMVAVFLMQVSIPPIRTSAGNYENPPVKQLNTGHKPALSRGFVYCILYNGRA